MVTYYDSRCLDNGCLGFGLSLHRDGNEGTNDLSDIIQSRVHISISFSPYTLVSSEKSRLFISHTLQQSFTEAAPCQGATNLNSLEYSLFIFERRIHFHYISCYQQTSFCQSFTDVMTFSECQASTNRSSLH